MAKSNLNSMRLLTQQKISYTKHDFPDTIHDAAEVATHLGIPANQVYKSLVVLRSRSKTKPILIMLAANRKLNLKRVAKAVQEKKVQMASHQQAERLTGLKVGGISALMLRNQGFDIYLDQQARDLDTILISAGQRGLNLQLAVTDLVKVTNAKWIEATD